mgnify:CR=1 FL=1
MWLFQKLFLKLETNTKINSLGYLPKIKRLARPVTMVYRYKDRPEKSLTGLKEWASTHPEPRSSKVEELELCNIYCIVSGWRAGFGRPSRLEERQHFCILRWFWPLGMVSSTLEGANVMVHWMVSCMTAGRCSGMISGGRCVEFQPSALKFRFIF